LVGQHVWPTSCNNVRHHPVIGTLPLLQVHELTVALTTTRSERDSAESERDRLKELHGQVKAALQESYSREQALMKQVRRPCRQAGTALACDICRGLIDVLCAATVTSSCHCSLDRSLNLWVGAWHCQSAR